MVTLTENLAREVDPANLGQVGLNQAVKTRHGATLDFNIEGLGVKEKAYFIDLLKPDAVRMDFPFTGHSFSYQSPYGPVGVHHMDSFQVKLSNEELGPAQDKVSGFLSDDARVMISEKVGEGVGTAVGQSVAGPVGGMIGKAVGRKIGESLTSEDDQSESPTESAGDLLASLRQACAENIPTPAQQAGLSKAVETAAVPGKPRGRKGMEEGLSMSL